MDRAPCQHSRPPPSPRTHTCPHADSPAPATADTSGAPHGGLGDILVPTPRQLRCAAHCSPQSRGPQLADPLPAIHVCSASRAPAWLDETLPRASTTPRRWRQRERWWWKWQRRRQWWRWRWGWEWRWSGRPPERGIVAGVEECSAACCCQPGADPPQVPVRGSPAVRQPHTAQVVHPVGVGTRRHAQPDRRSVMSGREWQTALAQSEDAVPFQVCCGLDACFIVHHRDVAALLFRRPAGAIHSPCGRSCDCIVSLRLFWRGGGQGLKVRVLCEPAAARIHTVLLRGGVG